MFTAIKSRIVQNGIVFISLVVTLTLFILGPSSIYFVNSHEISIPYGYFLLELLKPFVISNIIIIFILALIPNKIKKPVLGLVLAIGVAFWVQGVFLSSGYGVLDGGTDLDALKIQGIISSVTWIIILLAGVFLSRYIDKIIKPVFFIVVFSQIALMIPGMIDAVFNKSEKQNTITLSENDMKKQDAFNFSKEKNLIYIIVDAFDHSYLAQAIQNKTIAQEFKDFTIFTNYASAFGRTVASVPVQFAGKVYDNSVTIYDFIEQSFTSGESLPEKLKNSGWTNKLYTKSQGVYYLSPTLYDNAYKISGDNSYRGIIDILYAAYFRYMPHYFKSSFIVTQGAKEWDFWFLDMIREKDFSSNSEKPVFLTVHLWGTHAPFTISENLEVSEAADAASQTMASMQILKEFLDGLKEVGVYDNSIIVITADHGNDEYFNSHPALMIKNSNINNNEMLFNDIALSQLDMSDILFKLLNKQYLNISDIPPSNDRKFYSFNWIDFIVQGYLAPIKEVSVPDDVSDIAGYTETGLVYIPNLKTLPGKNIKIDFKKDYDAYSNIFSNKWKYQNGVVSAVNSDKFINTIRIRFEDDTKEFIKTTFHVAKDSLLCTDGSPITIAVNYTKEDFFCNTDNKIDVYSYYNGFLNFRFYTDVKFESIEFKPAKTIDFFKFKSGVQVISANLPNTIFTGFSIKEKSGRWLSSRSGTFILPVNEVDDKHKLMVNLDVSANLPFEDYKQKLAIKIGDYTLTEADFTHDKNRQRVSFYIPNELIQRDFVELNLNLSQKLEHPRDKDGNIVDNRYLGLYLSSVGVSYVPVVPYDTNTDVRDLDSFVFPNGWHAGETNRRWTSMEESSLNIPLESVPNKDIAVSLDMSAYLNQKLTSQIADIFMGDSLVGSVKFTDKKNKQTANFIVSKKLIGDKDFMPLTIRLRNKLSSPSEVGSGDRRYLGIALNSIKLTPINAVAYNAVIPVKDLDNSVFTSGWFAAEQWGRWSVAKESVMSIPLESAVEGDINVSMELSAYLNKKLTAQTVDILIGNKVVKNVKFNNQLNKQTVNFIIPKELVLGSSILPITFRLKNELASPADEGRGDKRKLGIAIKSIKIENDNNKSETQTDVLIQQ